MKPFSKIILFKFTTSYLLKFHRDIPPPHPQRVRMSIFVQILRFSSPHVVYKWPLVDLQKKNQVTGQEGANTVNFLAFDLYRITSAFTPPKYTWFSKEHKRRETSSKQGVK